MYRRPCLLAALGLGLPTPAAAAGFHLFRLEAQGGFTDQADWSAGVGARFFSDALHARVALGDPATGPLLREAWLESRALGPVIGVVRPELADLVRERRVPWLLPWTAAALGGEAATRRRLVVDVSHHRVLNLAAFADVDSHAAWVGPSVGLGAESTWWVDYAGSGRDPLRASLTAEAGFGGGLTLRDTWYLQAAAVTQVGLFGEHAWEARARGATGLSFERLGAPVGLELGGEVHHGDHNVTAEVRTTTSGRVSVWWQLAPPYQTRIEERVEQATAVRTGF